MTEYNVDHFIAKFEAIPEDQWITGVYSDDHGNHCAFGHCGTRHKHAYVADWTDEGKALIAILPETMFINDGEHKNYPQPTPKQRILAALRDIKAGQK